MFILGFFDASLLIGLGFVTIITIFFTRDNIAIIIICLILGIITMIFTNTLGSFWTNVRHKQREELIKRFDIELTLAKIICYDFGGQSGNTWFFRVYASFIIGFSIFRLVSYIIE